MDASVFKYSQYYRDGAFEEILNACIEIYHRMMKSNTNYPNIENTIRDGFGTYLSDDDFKNQTYPLMNYHYEPEVIEDEGRVDMKILKVNPYEGTKAYYIIECKRLDGSKKLNQEYIKNGICRFVCNYYSTNFNCNGLFGFIVKDLDISRNTEAINSMLPIDYINDRGKRVNSHSIKPLTKYVLRQDFEHTYISSHRSDKIITLYHAMFDFTRKIT